MDFPLLFLALVMLFLFNDHWEGVEVGEMMAKLQVLFFVCELFLQVLFNLSQSFGILARRGFIQAATR